MITTEPTTADNTVYLLKINVGLVSERIEVVRPLKVSGNKTLVAYIYGSSVRTKWVTSSRIEKREALVAS